MDDINIKKTRISSDEPVIQISEVRLVENDVKSLDDEKSTCSESEI